jgi:type VI secretion system secreted protein Hcp
MRSAASLLLALLSLLAATSVCAQTNYVFCEIKANGNVIPGTAVQPPNSPVDLQNYIPMFSFASNVSVARDPVSGQATGRRTYDPITLVKALDQTSPLIAKALVQNQQIEAKCKFFRTAQGLLEHYFTIEIRQGRVASIQQTGNGQVNNGMREMVQLTFQTIVWTDVQSSFTFEDQWSSDR